MGAKSFAIPKEYLLKSYLVLQSRYREAGIDLESLKAFEARREDILHVLWNRMSSGSYYPPAVKCYASKRRNIGPLGVADAAAQLTARQFLDPCIEPFFHDDSYGYRRKRSPGQAVSVVRERCGRYDWVLVLRVMKLHETMNHDLLFKAVEKHVKLSWLKLYISRWVKIRCRMPGKTYSIASEGLQKRGAVNQALMNLYVHYAFDAWMEREFKEFPFVRYAEHIVVHGVDEQGLKELAEGIESRLDACSLLLHPQVRHVLCCRAGHEGCEPFTFLGISIAPQEEAQHEQ